MKLRIKGNEEAKEQITEVWAEKSIAHPGEIRIAATVVGDPHGEVISLAWITPEGIRLRKDVPKEFGFALGPAGELAVLPYRPL